VTEHMEYRVTALKNGTVIDHLPAGMALKALEVLGFHGDNVVTVGMYLDSRKYGKKDLVKLENKELSEEEIAKIAILGPHTTLAIIRDYRVVAKVAVNLADEIAGVATCPNPSCITNHDDLRTRFHVLSKHPLRVRCHYCERVVTESELEVT
jgi:aspartate carbamoyltransferase regulatory subunit